MRYYLYKFSLSKFVLQGGQSLNTDGIDMELDTPQNENGPQIDTDTLIEPNMMQARIEALCGVVDLPTNDFGFPSSAIQFNNLNM